jgi:hypothetical protein
MVECKRSRDEMANNDAIESLCGLPVYSLSDDALIALARTLTRCLVAYASSHSYTWISDATPPHAMPFLIRLLSTSCTSVRLAAVEAIYKIVLSSWRDGWELIWQFANPLLPMCLLCSDCRNLAELKSIILAVCRVVDILGPPKPRILHFNNDSRTMNEIDRHLVQPLLNCIGNENSEIQMGTLLALRSLSCNRFLMERFRATVISHLMPYLSTDSDVDYVVFARTILDWVDFDDNVQGPNVQKIMQRLLRLLPHGQDYVVDHATAIKYMEGCTRSPFVKMVVLGEAQRFISLLSSPNLEVVRAVLKTIDIFIRCGSGDYINFFIGHGLIPALVPHLSTDLCTVLRPALQLIWYMQIYQEEKIATHAMVVANIIPHLVRLIPSCETFYVLVTIMSCFSETGDGLDALERAGFAQPLISRICRIGEGLYQKKVRYLLQKSAKLREELGDNILANGTPCPVWLKEMHANVVADLCSEDGEEDGEDDY